MELAAHALEALWISLRVAASATALVTPPALALGWLLARRDFRGKSLVETVVALPLVLPPTAIGYLLLRLFGRGGPLSKGALGFDPDVLLTWKGAVLAAACMSLPLSARTARAAFEGVPERLERMGRSLGLSRARVLATITLPLARSGLLAALVLGFGRALGEFGATVVVAGNIPGRTQTLALAIFDDIQLGRDRRALALVALSAVLAFALVYWVERLQARGGAGAMSLSVRLRQRLPPGDFELDVELESRSQALGLFGPSGAGKTSLLEALCGWRAGGEGRVVIGGRTLLDSSAGISLSPEARHVGYVPQDLLLFPHWDVRRNLLCGGRAPQRRAAFEQVVAVLELADLLGRTMDQLSGGERQRVALGRALCSGPDLLALDEPLASLDAALRRRILPYLLRVREELGTPLVLVSHDATELSALCDEVAVLRRGRIVAQGAPAEVFAGPHGGLSEGEELDNVLRGTVTAAGSGTASLRVSAEVSLEVPRGELALGDEALVAVRADDVLLALERPRGISARNVLPARVAALLPRGDEVLVRLELGAGCPLVAAALTPGAVAELGLEPGRQVILLVKSRSCRLLAVLARS